MPPCSVAAAAFESGCTRGKTSHRLYAEHNELINRRRRGGLGFCTPLAIFGQALAPSTGAIFDPTTMDEGEQLYA